MFGDPNFGFEKCPNMFGMFVQSSNRNFQTVQLHVLQKTKLWLENAGFTGFEANIENIWSRMRTGIR